MNLKERLQGGIIGVATGDALGVPYEICSRVEMEANPAKDMIGFQSHNQPAGTWSDDSSLTFCLMEGLIPTLHLELVGKLTTKWLREDYWCAAQKAFGSGGTTRKAVHKLEQGFPAISCGGTDENSNGNGSLMRILPLAFYLKDEKKIATRFSTVQKVSSITHAHFRSVFACFIFVEFGILLLQGLNKFEAYEKLKTIINKFSKAQNFDLKEVTIFDRILNENIFDQDIQNIRGSGYVVHALEASLWCFFNTNSYAACVLKAVNLGEDTDTTAAIAGGLAGMYYGADAIPQKWKTQLARYEDIQQLIHRFYESLQKQNAYNYT
jgi:ADP-ribosylglycohydrolase